MPGAFSANGINNGLLVIKCDTSSFQESDRTSIEVSAAIVRVNNVTRQLAVAAVTDAVMING